MRKFEIKAFSYEEAKAKALENGMTIIRNVTPSFKNEKPVDFDAFAQAMLKKNNIDTATGVGCIVVMEAGSSDTRERPYELVNNIVEGSLSKKRFFEVRKKSDNALVAEAETKGEAIRLAKNCMKNLREDLVCKQVYRVLGAHELAFELKYVPSANTKEGRYIVFGN
jgi:hypothetical protein